MMMSDEGTTSYGWEFDGDGDDGFVVGADDDVDADMSMDMDSFLSILNEDPLDASQQSGLVDPSLSIAPGNESASHAGVNEYSQTVDDHSEASASRTVYSSGSSDCERQTVNYGLTNAGPVPDVSSMNFSSSSPADWVLPVPPGNGISRGFPLSSHYDTREDFRSSSYFESREPNFGTATGGETSGISDGNVDNYLMDNSGINDGMYRQTSEAPFIDANGYSEVSNNPDHNSSMPHILNKNESSYSATHPIIYTNGLLFNEIAASGSITLPSSESSTEIPANGSSNGNHFPSTLPNRKQIASTMEGKVDVGSEKSSKVVGRLFTDKSASQPFSGVLNSFSRINHVVKGEQDIKRSRQFINIRSNPVGPGQSFVHQNISIKKQVEIKEELENKFAAFTNIGSIPQKVNTSAHVTIIDDDDPDICILEDLSEPAPKKHTPLDVKSLILAQRSSFVTPPVPVHIGLNNARVKVNDEQIVYRAALQDLSQPKSEAFAPDGALEVPLLRHQRIALSWMIQKETKSMHCLGGILADDQGLGKTISTISLILKERSPSSSAPAAEMKKMEAETFNLDDDDDDQKPSTNVAETAGNSNDLRSTSGHTISRPAAGTLVVCPTSVLRQWNDELHNKVSSKARLSVLVYHGANRTKDPSELAKYDVVLTTYAIVSMEVPKQPLADEDEDETKRRNEFHPVGISSGNKRKYPPGSSKKSKKKKGIDSELFESLARPLAKVRWFRVVLDEAQSIKNHRTQVARACWGLRAKRRWCLSGTPIQNSIDDLYSYFRFLRYDPYAVYKLFCSTIKVPIQRSPTTGYKKLQAVLKTIMLRRTKATLLDGEPIICLPPKTINLKKVDFTPEEREFYCRLEADSRAQFEEYAAAGTVKQNYVNILLMLLRLRQACDHPLLVKGCNSDTQWKSSLDKAKKLPPEKRIGLLNCLEASLAICSVCSDPPEDAVVTTCEHVFCNQCILEHLSSDDSQCPFPKCKVILNTSSVFSKSTLKVSLCDQPRVGNALDCSSSVKSEVIEPCSSSGSVNSLNVDAAEALDSSKIKAAVEVLESIAKPREIAIDNKDGDGHGKGKVVVREKAIVFSQWTRMLDLLEACLKGSSIGYRRLDGTMSVHARDKAVKDFNTLPEVSVMIMSLKAASLGLNMVAACHVLLLDLWWNPTTEDQAIDRAHRIGQTRPVSVLRLTVRDTVEDRILALQQKKRVMVSSAFGEDETGGSQTRLTVDDLKYLFQGS
nr:helicase, C-terminal [Tanacetum cinerariifolium]